MITVSIRKKLLRLEWEFKRAKKLLDRAVRRRRRAAETMKRMRKANSVIRAAARAHWGIAVDNHEAAASEFVRCKFDLIDYKDFIVQREKRLKKKLEKNLH